MKKIITAAVLLLATALSAFSQTKNITVSGRVLEDTNEPAVQATIQLLSLPDSAYAAGVATTGNGYFTLPKVNAGKYVLKVSYIGFKNKFLPLHLYANVRNSGGSAASAGGGRYADVQFLCLSHAGRGYAGRTGEETARCGNR